LLEGQRLFAEDLTLRIPGNQSEATANFTSTLDFFNLSANDGSAMKVLPGEKGSAITLRFNSTFLTVPAKFDPWDADLEQKSEVKVLAAPRISVVGNQTALVQVGGTQAFSYLVPAGDGCFRRERTPPQQLGIKFSLAVQPVKGEETSVELSPLEVEIASLEGRYPVPGLDLNVGKPIIARRTLHTSTRVELGTTSVVPFPSGPKVQAALLLRVKQQLDQTQLLRRIMLDITGRLPTVEEARQFAADRSPDRIRKLIDRILSKEKLLQNEEFLRHILPGEHEGRPLIDDKDPETWKELVERLLRSENARWAELLSDPVPPPEQATPQQK